VSSNAVEASTDDSPTPTEPLFPHAVTVGRSGAVRGPLPSGGHAVQARQDHAAIGSPRPSGGPWLLQVASSAGLKGCGGAHFPAARKWQSALEHAGPVTLVVNAAESEWLSAKDVALLWVHPHLVLDGAAVLAETVGAARIIVWLHESASLTRRSVVAACRERSAKGHQEPPVDIVAAPAAYLSGESTAIRSAVRGGPALPRFHVTRSSRADAEILVHNVETLARLAILAGSPSGSAPDGSRLLTVLTATRERRVVDVPTAMCLSDAVEMAVGCLPRPTSAVLLGGYGGSWARWSDVAGVPVAEEVMREEGHPLGPGIVAPLWHEGCGIGVTSAIADYLARSSAGQCGPCLFGLAAIAESLKRLTSGPARPAELDLLRRDLDVVPGRGACHHPDGAARLVRTALEVFADDVALHASGGSCRRPSSGLIPLPEHGWS